jgi:putative redox protein
MKQVLVSWDAGAARFVAQGSHQGHPITINAPHEGAPTGFSASELLLAGVGACSAWDVVEILRKQRLAVSGVDVEVRGEQDAEAPWPFRRIEAVFRVRGRSLPLRAVQRAVQLSEERYCAVIATVRGVADVRCAVEVLEDDPEEDRVASGSGSAIGQMATESAAHEDRGARNGIQ